MKGEEKREKGGTLCLYIWVPAFAGMTGGACIGNVNGNFWGVFWVYVGGNLLYNAGGLLIEAENVHFILF